MARDLYNKTRRKYQRHFSLLLNSSLLGIFLLGLAELPAQDCSSLTITCTSADVHCDCAVLGNIEVSVSGGTGPYSFLWSNGSTSEDLTELYAGDYSVTVTDADGCTASCSAIINTSTNLLMNLDDIDIQCGQENSGSIDLMVLGGAGVYSYLWNTGATTEDLTNLGPGTYQVTVTDASGCTGTNSKQITAPPTLSLACEKTDVECADDNTGEINLTANGGVPPLTYLWSNGETTEDVMGLVAGNYSVTVTDANGCEKICSAVVEAPDPLELSCISQDLQCGESNNGSVNLIVSGGLPPYTFLWNTDATTEDIENLGAGLYEVIVTDANGCVETCSSSIFAPPALTITCSSTGEVCGLPAAGSIELQVEGGVGPYTYQWNDGATTEDRNSLFAGNYEVTVTDALGCTQICTSTVEAAPTINLDCTATALLCGTPASGNIDLTVSSGLAPYTFQWSNGATTEDLGGLDAGSYSVTVTDANGCIGVCNAEVEAPALLSLSCTGSAILCGGTNTGSIDLSITGGMAPFSILWSNGSALEDQEALVAGDYSVTVTDANGCTAACTTVIDEPSTLTASCISQPTECLNPEAGSIDLTVTGGLAPYTFNWSNNATSEDINNLTSGNYSVTITDANACTAVCSSVVGVPEPPIAFGTGTDTQCGEGPTGSIDLNVFGGVAPYTYAWSTGATTEDLANLSSGAYLVTVTDAEGCTNSTVVVVGESSGMVVDCSAEPVQCGDDFSGSVTANVSGGNGPFNYQWNTGETTASINGVTAGTYSVTVSDSNGCTESCTATVGEPQPISVACTAQDLTCTGAADGSVSLASVSGTAPYTYEWSNGATSASITNLNAGTYGVTVTDAEGCTGTCTAQVKQPIPLNVFAFGTDISCFGLTDGSAFATATGGKGPYNYAWSNGINTIFISNLAAGSYTVTVTDVNGCTASSTAFIQEPAVLDAVCVAQDILCSGSSDGGVNLTVSGGTAPYSYSWDTGNTEEDLTNIAEGTYSVTVTDASGCTTTCSSTINTQSFLSIECIAQDALCGNEASGNVDLTITDGTAPFLYQWSNGTTSEDLTNVVAGTYTVTVMDATGCTRTCTSVVAPAPMIQTFAGGQNISCFGETNGSVDLTVLSGEAPYTYQWNNGATTEDISDLGIGIYTVTTTDANGCTGLASATITQPNQLMAFCFGTDTDCSGTNGSAFVTAVGGKGPYNYAWSNGINTLFISNLTPGTYTVTVTDANGCTQVCSSLIGGPTALNLACTPTNVNCAQQGSIDLNATGGAAPYSFAWSNGATTEDLTNLPVGAYTVTLTDANGCTATCSTGIEETPPINITCTPAVVNCADANSGAINTQVSGGLAPYTYQWSNGATTENLNNIPVGDYEITVTDAEGCSSVCQTEVVPAEPVYVIPDVTHLQCGGTEEGTVNLTVWGGTAPFTYLWDNGATTDHLSGVGAGQYVVTVTDAYSCTSTCIATINGPSELTAACSSEAIDCAGANDGTVTVLVTGGVGPYTYQWNTGATTATLNNLPGGIYSVTVTDANNCEVSCSRTVFEPTALTVSCTSESLPCAGEATGSAHLNVSGGTAPYTYLWNNGATTTDLTNLSTGTYEVTVTDANGCTASCTTTIEIPTTLALSCSSTAVLCHGTNTGTASVIPSGGTAPYTFTWSNGATTAQLDALVAGDYAVTITDANGCTATCGVSVEDLPTLAVTCISEEIACHGDNLGAASVNVSGGQAPYSFVWSNGSTSATIDNLTAGDYTVTVVDANGCEAICTTVIDEPTALTITCNSETTDCTGSATGQAGVSVSGGTAPYTYQWNTGATTSGITNLVSGGYTVTVTDSKGCVAICQTTVDEPAALIATCQSEAVECTGSNSGSVEVIATGGLSPYQYVWSNGATDSKLNNLPAGTYKVTITDAKGCTAICESTVNETVAMVLSCNNSAVQCAGANTGSVGLTVGGGVAPFTYLWSNGATTSTVDALTAGSYSVTVTDANGCTASCQTQVEEITHLTISVNKTDVVCNGADNGKAGLQVEGGTPPYTFQWSNGGTTAELDNLTAGLYEVTVTDANGCSGIASLEIGEPEALNLSLNINEPSCESEEPDGAIFISVNGGVSPYLYSINDGDTFQDSPDFVGLVEGVYSIIVVDAQGCRTSDMVELTDEDCVEFCTQTVEFWSDHMEDVKRIIEEYTECVDTTTTHENPPLPCLATAAEGHAMWLNDYQPNGNAARFLFSENAPGELLEFADGTAQLRGEVYNKNNPDDVWVVDVHLSDRMNWEEWSALGRSYKDENDHAGDHYLDWSYYILSLDRPSTLTGKGINEGRIFTLAHNPTSYYYGFQVGIAANSKNPNYGMSGWFLRTENGTDYVNSDFNLDLACPEDTPPPPPPCLADAAEGGGHALWLNDYQPNGNAARFFFNENTLGELVEFEDGTAELHGEVYNKNNPDDIWVIDVYLADRMNWEEWSGLGRSYKDENGHVGDHYLDWSYYILSLDRPSTLTGKGINEGRVFTLAHNPTDYYYGFQVGIAANSKNPNYGMSGWFLRTENGTDYINGDFNLDLYCEETPSNSSNTSCCEELGKPYILTLKYTGGDCASSDNEQSDVNFHCSGDLSNEAIVHIIANDKANHNNGKIWFDDVVELGSDFVLDPYLVGEHKLSSTTFIHIFDLDGNQLQEVEFHTSCSEPIAVGDT